MTSRTGSEKYIYAELMEQPANKVRFTYATEKKRGKVQGARSTRTRKTFMKLKIKGSYKGDAEVTMSCVSSQPISENKYP